MYRCCNGWCDVVMSWCVSGVVFVGVPLFLFRWCSVVVRNVIVIINQ